MAKFGSMQKQRNAEWRSMFDPDTGVATGMEVDEAFAIVLDLARDAVTQGEADHNENVEALGIVEKVRYLIEKGSE